MRRAVALLAALALLPISVSPALANNRPQRVYVPPGPPIIAAPGDLCPFAIQIDFPFSDEYATVYNLPGGTEIDAVTGSVGVSVSNTDKPGKTITVDVTVPATFTTFRNGSLIWAFTGLTFAYDPTLPKWGFPSGSCSCTDRGCLPSAPPTRPEPAR